MTESDGAFEPEVVEWADGTEYVFGDARSMEKRLAARLEQGESPAELREELLASGQAAWEVDDAFANAEAHTRVQRKEQRRANRNKLVLRAFMGLMLVFMLASTIVGVLRSLGIG